MAYVAACQKLLFESNPNMRGQKKKVAFMPPYLINRISFEGKYRYNYVKKWGRKFLEGRSPLEYDAIVFFCNVGDMHWQLVVLYPQHGRIETMDSYRFTQFGSNLDAVYRWLYDEVHTHFPEQLSQIPAFVAIAGRNYGLQYNGYDCGVFCILWALALRNAHNLRASVSEGEVTKARQRLLLFLLGDKNSVSNFKETLIQPDIDLSELDLFGQDGDNTNDTKDIN